MEYKVKSLKLNMAFNIIRNLTIIIFPLISFPYVSKILGVESLGRYNFAVSVISYISLLAALGIEFYSIREGAKLRDDKEKFSEFANQIFSINVVSTIFAYVVLGVLLLCVPKFAEYRTLLLILGSQVIFTTLGVNWIYSIYEEYIYISIRGVIVQIISIILMFLFIKSPSDVEKYAIITVIASVGANIFNFFFSRRYCKVKFVFLMSLKTHIKPILTLFAMYATSTIYANSDMIILGFISGEHSVGVYSVAVKVYNIVKGTLAAATIVSIPRLSLYLGQKRQDEANALANNVHSIMYTMVVPGIIGLISLGEPIILLISDASYAAALVPHIILSVAMFFNLGAYFWGQAVLVSANRENVLLKSTIVCALVNVLLNFILIPFGQEKAAALTTLIAEAIAFVWCYFEGRKCVKISGAFNLLLKVLVGCVPIPVIAIVLKFMITNIIIYTVITVILSVIAYAIVEILIKNEAVTDIFVTIKRKIIRK